MKVDAEFLVLRIHRVAILRYTFSPKGFFVSLFAVKLEENFELWVEAPGGKVLVVAALG